MFTFALISLMHKPAPLTISHKEDTTMANLENTETKVENKAIQKQDAINFDPVEAFKSQSGGGNVKDSGAMKDFPSGNDLLNDLNRPGSMSCELPGGGGSTARGARATEATKANGSEASGSGPRGAYGLDTLHK